MGCGTNIVPGFNESNKIKDTGLQMKMDHLMSAPHSVGRTLKENTAFKKWFGKSKIVDRNGNPLIVYHGSPQAGFTKFDIRKANPYDPDTPVDGLFFTDRKRSAKSAAMYKWGQRNRTANEVDVRGFYLRMENPATRRELLAVYNDMLENREYTGRESLRKRMISLGYDGMIFVNPHLDLQESLEKDGYYEKDGLKFKVTTSHPHREIDYTPQERGEAPIYGDLVTFPAVRVYRGHEHNGHIIDYTGDTVAEAIKDAVAAQEGTYVVWDSRNIKSASANIGRYGKSSNVYK